MNPQITRTKSVVMNLSMYPCHAVVLKSWNEKVMMLSLALKTVMRRCLPQKAKDLHELANKYIGIGMKHTV